MKRLKQWLYNRFLPAWCKEDLLKANAHLTRAVSSQRLEIDQLNAYIDGMHAAMKHRARIVIHNGKVKRE